MSNRDENSVGSIASDVDFKQYLDAVNKASDRSRGAIYLLLIYTVLSIGTYKLVYSEGTIFPRAWAKARMERYRDAYLAKKIGPSGPATSVEQQYGLPWSVKQEFRLPWIHIKESEHRNIFERLSPTEAVQVTDRKELTSYTAHQSHIRHLETLSTNNSPSIDKQTPKNGQVVEPKLEAAKLLNAEYDHDRTMLEYSTKQYFDSLSITLPIIGVKFDVNDLPLVFGCSAVALLFLTFKCFSNEEYNLRVAMRVAPDRKALEGLMMHQVIVKRTDERNLTPWSQIMGCIKQLAFHMPILLPCILMLLFVVDDLCTIELYYQYLKPIWAWIMIGVHLLLAVLMIKYCWLAFERWTRLTNIVRDIERMVTFRDHEVICSYLLGSRLKELYLDAYLTQAFPDGPRNPKTFAMHKACRLATQAREYRRAKMVPAKGLDPSGSDDSDFQRKNSIRQYDVLYALEDNAKRAIDSCHGVLMKTWPNLDQILQISITNAANEKFESEVNQARQKRAGLLKVLAIDLDGPPIGVTEALFRLHIHVVSYACHCKGLDKTKEYLTKNRFAAWLLVWLGTDLLAFVLSFFQFLVASKSTTNIDQSNHVISKRMLSDAKIWMKEPPRRLLLLALASVIIDVVVLYCLWLAFMSH